MAKQPPKKEVFQLDQLPCKFGNLNIGTETCAIAVTIERGPIDYEALEPVVVGARLDVCLTYDPQGRDDVQGQDKLIDTEVEGAIRSVVDCPSLKITNKSLGFRLSFSLGSVDVSDLLGLAQARGKISITRVGTVEPKKRGRKRRVQGTHTNRYDVLWREGH